jgi:hypothetical protein
LTNDTAKRDKLREILSDFKKQQENADAEGRNRIAEAEAVINSVNARIKAAPVGSPEYFRWCDFRKSLYQRVQSQIDLMQNAIAHYMLALHTAIAVETILEEHTPTLPDELERMKEELRKTINDEIAKKISGLFSAEGHEAMYG